MASPPALPTLPTLLDMESITVDKTKELEQKYADNKKPPKPSKPAPPPTPAPAPYKPTAADKRMAESVLNKMAAGPSKPAPSAAQNKKKAEEELKQKILTIRKIQQYQRHFSDVVLDDQQYDTRFPQMALDEALANCQADVNGANSEKMINGLLPIAGKLLEQGTVHLANPLEWDLTGFGDFCGSEEAHEALRPELIELRIHMGSYFEAPWYMRLFNGLGQMAHTYSEGRKVHLAKTTMAPEDMKARLARLSA